MAAPMPCCISPVLAPVRARAAGASAAEMRSDETPGGAPAGQPSRVVRSGAGSGRHGRPATAAPPCAALCIVRWPWLAKPRPLAAAAPDAAPPPSPLRASPFPSPPPSVLRSRGAGARCGRRGQAGGGRGRALPGVPQGVLVAQDCRVLDAVPWGLCQAFRRASRAVLDRIALGRLQDLTSA